MSQSSSIGKFIPPLSESDRTRGSLNAPITLMEYGDYQCPQSGQTYFTFKELQQKLGNQFCFVYRHFPLCIHPQASIAAEVAEAANAQGKFWQMHDKLFENQQHLTDGELVEYAAQLNLDMIQFLQELAEHIHQARVQADIESGQQYGVESTPTFFIGIRHQGADNIEALLGAILIATKLVTDNAPRELTQGE